MNDLNSLIDKKPDVTEQDVHLFFENNPAAIIGWHHSLGNTLITKYALGNEFITDFAWVNPQSGESRVYLIEIEKPSKPIFNKDHSFTKEFHQARTQVTDWLLWCRNNSQSLHYSLNKLHPGNHLPRAFSVRGILIYGRSSEINHPKRENRWASIHHDPFIEIRTYDGWAREMNRTIPPNNIVDYLKTKHYCNEAFEEK